jgi:hypothetical protein
VSGTKNVAFLTDRGGRRILGQFDGTVEVRWSRRRDDVSQGSVHVRDAGKSASSFMHSVEAVRHELLIVRNDEEVWQGPMMLPKQIGPTAVFTARDMLFFTQRTVTKQAWSSAFPTSESVIERTERILRQEMIPWDAAGARFLQGLRPVHGADDAGTGRVTPAYSQYVWDDMDALAARSGMDYTVANRLLYLHDTHNFLSMGRRLTDDDFLNYLEISQYGTELAVVNYVTDNQGRAKASRVVDDYYGPVELLASAYDLGNATSTEITDQELQEQATRNARSRYPAPRVLRVPENSSLKPSVVDELMPWLVPGNGFEVYSNSSGREISNLQKLDKVDVIENVRGERVTVSLSPAPLGSGVEEVELA